MIRDIPTKDDYYVAGIDLMNHAWDIVVELTQYFKESEVETWDSDGSVTDEYWEKAQLQLSNVTTITQQAQEYLLKGRIVEISPYLLLSDQLRDRPKGCDKKDISFSEFKTTDAQNLIKIHNTVYPDRLNNEEMAYYEKLRRLRNALIHGLPKEKRITQIDAYENILCAYRIWFPNGDWFQQRSRYLDDDVIATLYSNKYSFDRLVFEFNLVISVLSPASCRNGFNFRKRNRAYICPFCHVNVKNEDPPRSAQLIEKQSGVKCVLCGQVAEVQKVKSHSDQCKGIYVAFQKDYWGKDEHEYICLTCGDEVENILTED